MRSSWQICLYRVACRWKTVPAEWQTKVVVPIFKKKDGRMCSNNHDVTLFSLPRISYARVLERRLQL